jgi:hypothetical protein
MIQELESDIEENGLYISSRLSSLGKSEYPNLLKEAVVNGNDASLATQLKNRKLLIEIENRQTKAGRLISAAVPDNAAETLAEGEFNRYYIRGLCRRAIEDGIPDLVIYRAKVVMSPRQGSEARIGMRINPSALLGDLRKNIGVETALGVPAGPNSGLSVRLP